VAERTLSAQPDVTVVVLTHDRRDTVLRTVDGLLRLDPPPAVVVVDNGSVDGTAAALRARFPAIVVAALPRNLGAAGRNVGVRLARSEHVALCDDDTLWAPGALETAAALLDAWPSLAIVTGRVLVGADQRPDETCARMAASPLATPPGMPGRVVLGFLAGASMVRRSAFLAAGGFEPRFFLGGEEHVLALDLAARGHAILYAPAVAVHHHPSPQRDARARRRLLLRNALWAAGLRRPLGRALVRTLELVAANPPDRLTLRAAAEAVAGLPWVLTRRRRLPVHVEEALRLVEASARRSAPATAVTRRA